MPKVVDHEKQREVFAEAAMRLIAREGFDGMTMRAVAKEAGLSYGSLFHYFQSKEELLECAARCLARNQIAESRDEGRRRSGMAQLERLLCLDAVVDDASSRDAWVVWTAFALEAAIKPSLRSLHAEMIERWLETLRHSLEAAKRDGDVRPEVDVEAESLALWAFAGGLGQRALLHPELLTPERQKSLVNMHLDKLRPTRRLS